MITRSNKLTYLHNFSSPLSTRYSNLFSIVYHPYINVKLDTDIIRFKIYTQVQRKFAQTDASFCRQFSNYISNFFMSVCFCKIICFCFIHCSVIYATVYWLVWSTCYDCLRPILVIYAVFQSGGCFVKLCQCVFLTD